MEQHRTGRTAVNKAQIERNFNHDLRQLESVAAAGYSIQAAVPRLRKTAAVFAVVSRPVKRES